MNVLQSAQELIKKEFVVLVREFLLLSQNGRQVCFHQLLYNINVLELFAGLRKKDSLNVNNLE